VVLTVMVLPIALKLSDPEVSKRFAETSAFATLDPILKSNLAIAEDGGGAVAKLIHHRDTLMAHVRDNEWQSGALRRIVKGDVGQDDIPSIRILSTIILLELLIADLEFYRDGTDRKE